MLTEVFIKKALRDAMEEYAAGHDGKRGISKIDAIEAVTKLGGDMDDVRAVMTKAVDLLILEKDRDRFV